MKPATTTIEALKLSSATWIEALAAVHEELETEETPALASTTALSTMDFGNDEDPDGISVELRGLLRRLQQLETTMAHLNRAATEVTEQRETSVELAHQQLLANQKLMQQLLEGLSMESGLSLEEQREQETLNKKLNSMYRSS